MTDREKIIYDILCSDEQPPEGQHWEGFVTNKIVAALAQPEQEPVAWISHNAGLYHGKPDESLNPLPLYTTTPQREVYCGCGDEIVAGDGARCGTCVAVKYKEKEWQGLTDEEIGAMEKEYLFGGKEFDDEIGYWAVYRAIEAKLKQKNYQSALHNMNKAAEKNGEEL